MTPPRIEMREMLRRIAIATVPHLTAEQVIEHHNWVWSGLIAPHGVQVMPAREL